MPDPVFEIIGVVADIRNQEWRRTSSPEDTCPSRDIYQYHLPHDSGSNLSADPHSLVPTIRTESRAIDKNMVHGGFLFFLMI